MSKRKPTGVLIPPALRPLLIPLAKLTEYPKNAQKHTPEDVEKFREVLREFGWTNPIVAWGKNGTTYISAGHLRYNAAKAEGLTEVPVLVRRDWTERQFRAYTIADNQWTRKATQDFALLKDELVDLDDGQFDLTLTGFERNEVYALVHGKGGKAGLTDDDAVPQSAPSRTKPGDVWLCGKHRVMCGDSTKTEDVARLMRGGKADAVVTDPPYGVDYQGGASNAVKREKLAGDLDARLYSACFAAPVVYAWFAGCNVGEVFAAMKGAGWTSRAVIVWNKLKPHYGAASADYKQRHELCLYAVKGVSHFCGPTNEPTVWDIEQARVNELHPTQKPVECMMRPIGNHKAVNIYDPFLGSGTTLIACEKLGRVCYGCEIEPKYVSVAVRRWQDFTGRKATLEATGETFD